MITPLYFDTSAAAKLLFRNEQGTPELVSYLRRLKSYSMFASNLLQIEIRSAMRRKILESSKTSIKYYTEFQAWKQFETKRIIFIPIDEEVVRHAASLIEPTSTPGIANFGFNSSRYG